MIRRLCIVVFVASVAIVAAIVHPASVSAFQEAVFSEFNLSASADLLALGQSTTLSVGPVQDFGGATGDVEFYISSSSTSCTLTESANVIAVVPIGSPTYSWTPGAINPIPGFPVCAVYIPGPGDQYGSDTSGPVTVIVNDAEVGSSSLTQFDLGASPNPLTNGSTATLTANVNGNFGLPTGNILFYVSTSSTSCIQTGSPYTTNEEPVIAVGDSPGDGIATGPYPASSPGTVSICAKYVPFPGSDPYVSSTAGPYLLTVNVYPPNITVGTSPSSIPNGFVSSLTATVTGSHGVPPGTVQFFISDSSTSCASINQYLSVAQVNSETGVATFSYTANGGGTFPICAYYIPAASSDPYSTATSTTPSVLTVTTYPFTSFSLTASPTTLGENNSTTLTVNVSGNDGLPPSYVEFYLSSSSTSCVYGGGNYFGYVYFSPTEGPGSGIATYTYTPGASGPLNICAIYEPDYEDPYGFATTGPTPLTVNPPVALTVLPPTPMLQTQPIAFNFILTPPNGQPAPTGNITVYDSNESCDGSNYGCSIGSVPVNGGGNYGPVLGALSSNQYTAVYSGDSNYGPVAVYGTVLVLNGLSTVSPVAVTTGSGNTQFTLTGPGIASNSLAGLTTVSGAQPVINPDNINATANPPQLQFTIPSADLNTVGEIAVVLLTQNVAGGYTTTGGPLQIQVYAPFTDTAAVSTSPTTIPYGTALPASFNANVARASTAVDAAVPAGSVSFTLNGTGGNIYSAPLGSATLSQTSTPGTYLSPFTESIDQNGNGKLISADLNGDGYVDVVGLPAFYYPYAPFEDDAEGPYLQVMLSTGFDGFQAEQQVYTGCEAQDFAVGDVDGDGIPDLVVVCGISEGSPTPSNLLAYYMPGINNGSGQGTGSFGPPVQFGANSPINVPTQVVLGQFNNDGNNDIAVIDGDNGNIQVISLVGGEQDGPLTNFSNTIQNYGAVVTAAAADFNQDGFSDLVLEEYNNEDSGNGGITVFLSQGAGNGFTLWNQQSFSASTYSMQSMTVTDTNGDGYPDVAIADPGDYLDGNEDDPGNLLVFGNYGASSPGNLYLAYSQQINAVTSVVGLPFPTIGQPTPGAAAIQGWNLTYTYIPDFDSNNIWIGQLLYNPSNGLVPVTNPNIPLNTGQQPYQYADPEDLPNLLVVGDMNGDGYLDFAITTETFSETYPYDFYNLVPFYYSNDAQTTLTVSSPPPTPPAGAYSLNIAYPGTQVYQSNTGSTPLYITEVTPTGSFTVSPTGSPFPFGTSLTFTATVTGVAGGAAPSGSVTFYDNDGTLGSGTLSSDGGLTATATYTTNQLALGFNTVSASYGGDNNYTQVSPLGTLQIQINTATPTLVLTGSIPGDQPPPTGVTTTAGTVVTFQAQSTNGITLPSGETIKLTGLPDAANVTPTINASGVATFNYGLFPPGTYNIQASYAGDGNYIAATSNTFTVTVNPTPVNVSLTSSANPVTYPAATNLTANATSSGLGVPTGTISFQNSGSPVGSGTLATVNGSSGLLSAGTTVDPITGQTDTATVTGDFNGDGKPDIAVLQGNADIASVLISLGNGDGTFGTPTSYSVDQASVSMASADFNGDGCSDLVIAASDGNVYLYLSTGSTGNCSLSLSSPQQFTVTGALGVATGNFNGYQGFAVVSPTNVTAFFNNGSGAFPPGGTWSAPSSGSQFKGITVADFNRDTFADIAVSDNSGPDVAVFLNTANGTGFTAPATYPVGVSASVIASGDINGDGYPDLAVVSNFDSTVAVLINAGTNSPGPGTFGVAYSYGVANQPTAIAMNDFNQDGFADIAVTGTGTGQNSGTTILLGSSAASNSTFTISPMVGEASLPTATGTSIATADFNGDGNPDLAVGYNGVSILLDSAAGATASGIVLPVGTNPLTGVFNPSESSTFVEGTSQPLNELVNPAATTTSAPNATATYSTAAQSVTLASSVISTAGTVNAGTVTFTVLQGATPVGTPVTSGTVTNGSASASYSLPAGVATGTYTIQAAYSGGGSFTASSDSTQTLVIGKATATVTLGSLSQTYTGSPLPATETTTPSGLSVTFTYNGLSAAPTAAGSYTVVGTINDPNYQGSSNGTLVISKATATLTLSSLSQTYTGSPLPATATTTPSGLSVAFTYNGSSTAPAAAGSYTVVGTISDPNYQGLSAGTLVIAKAAATVTLGSLSQTYTGSPLVATATTTPVGLAFAFTYNGSSTAPTAVGSYTVVGTIGDPNYQGSATGTLVIGKATATVTLGSLSQTYTGSPLPATAATTPSGLSVALTYNGVSAAPAAAGSYTVVATIGDPNYQGASTGTLVIGKATPSISWATPAAITYGTALSATQLNATSTTAGSFAYTPAAGVVPTAGSHALSVTLTPADTTDYNNASSGVTLTVNQATPVITWANPATITYGTALSATQLNATASTPGTFTYTPAAGTTLTAGTHALSVTFAPTDTTDYTSATATASITVNQATPTITWPNPAAITYGTALGPTQLNATASTPGTFTYSPAIGTTLTAGTHQLTATFLPTDSTDYRGVTATASITVNQAATTITWPNPTAINYGTPLSAAQLDATASVPGTFTYTPAIGTILAAGTQPLSVTFTAADSTDYAGSTATTSITVSKGTPSINWPAPAAITYGTALSATQLDATSATAGTFTYSPAAGTVLGAGVQTLTVTFTPTDTTDYSTTTTTIALTVNQATPVITWPTPAAISFGTQLSGIQLNATATPTGGYFTYAPPAGTTLPEGTQTLRVTYVPTDQTDYTTATASVVIQVNTTSVAIGLVSSTESTTAGSMVTFQVQASSATAPTGLPITLTGLPTAAPVTVTLDGDGFASYSYGLFPKGNYTIQASFAGNASFTAATSNTVSLAVAPTPAQVSLASSANPVTYPTPIDLTATAGSNGLGVPTGTISFQSDGIPIGAGTLATVNGSSGLVSVGTIDSVTGLTDAAVVTGDFNGDGKPDLAVLESNSRGTLLVSLGNGDGTFQAPKTYTVDATSVVMAAANLHSSQYSDLVIAGTDGTVTVMLATGDAQGDLAANQTLTVTGALGVATGNFNGGAFPDLAVIGPSQLAVFYNNGAGTFPSSASWTATPNGSQYTGIAAAAFAKDGFDDIAISDNSGPGVAVFLHNTDGGGFTGPVTYPVGVSAIAIASGDINGDGYPDLAVVSNVDSTVDVLINNGVGEPGTFPAGTIYGVASQPTSAAMNDFNKDGYADVAVAGTGTGQGGGTTILLGSSSGAMKSETSLPTAIGQSIASADFNNDGNPDLVVGLNGVTVFLDSAAQATASNVVLTGGTQPLTAVYTPAASSAFAAATSQAVSEVVNTVAATITWPNPASISYGTALSNAQLDATASVPGTFTYSPPIGSVLTVGTQQLNVTFVPSDSVDYVGATASVSISVTPAPTTLSWTNPAGITYGTPLTSTQLNATAPVPGTYTYSPVLGSVLTAGTHQLTVSFVPSDTLDYLGSSATVSLIVGQAASTITWPSPASIPYGTALGSNQLDATASVPGTFAYTPAAGTLLTAGPHILAVTFAPTDSTDYSSATNSVAITVNQGIPAISWAAPAAIPYGTALGTAQLSATANTPGTFTYTPPSGTVLGAGPQTLSVTFTPADATDYTTATASVPIQVNQATPVITWATPAAIAFGNPLTATQLNATAVPVGGTFTYTPAAGSVLPTGPQILSVKYVPADTVDYTSATASVTIQVNPGLALASIQPTSGAYQSAATTITLTGTGFTATSVVQLAFGAQTLTLASSYSSPSQMTAVVPASFFQQALPGAVTVTNPVTNQTTPSVPFTVVLPNIQVAFTGSGTQAPGEQPSVNLQFIEGYPLQLQVTLTLTVQPTNAGGPTDPNVQFSTGGTVDTFTLPANSTSVPQIQIQTGTLTGTITVNLTIEQNGQDVTPAGLQPVVITVPPVAPVITSVLISGSGTNLTVTVQGYSSTRDMSNASFTFTPAVSGFSIATPQVTIDVSSEFANWYAQAESLQFGSAFLYTQNFDLSSDSSAIGGVSVTLTNSAGTSTPATATN